MTSVPGQGPRILVVDDEPALRETIRAMFEPIAQSVITASSIAQAIALMQSSAVDIVLSDLYLPGEVGTELLHVTARQNHDPAVIIMSGKPELSEAVASVQMRAADFLLKPCSRATLLESIERAYLRLRQERASRTLRAEAPAQLLTAVERASIEAFFVALEAAEPDTCTHSLRVREYTMYLAELANYPESERFQLSYAALLHDVGKISIRDSIIDKPDRLTDKELEEVRRHPIKGAEMLSQIESLRGAVKIVRHHHEHFDGSGYPDRLKGQDIPFGARIFAVADTLDAMTSDRAYRSSLSFEIARAEIQSGSGTQFDPKIVALFLGVPAQQWAELRERADKAAKAGIVSLLPPSAHSQPAIIPQPPGEGAPPPHFERA